MRPLHANNVKGDGVIIITKYLKRMEIEKVGLQRDISRERENDYWETTHTLKVAVTSL